MKKSCLIFFILCTPLLVGATHLKAGEIMVRKENCSNRSYAITLILYGNVSSVIEPGGGILNFGDGTSITVPEHPFTARPDLGNDIGIFTFTIQHTYPLMGKVTVTYTETNRNEGVININHAVGTPLFLDTSFRIDLACSNSPELLTPPIDRACLGLSFFHNPGAFDADGDSLSYQIAVPLAASNVPVDYMSPIDPSFYGGNFNMGNENQDGPPQFFISAASGNLTWDAPGHIGEYNIAIVITEWRKINDAWLEIGSVRRDMQIIVEECDNNRPELVIPQDTCVFAGSTITKNIFGFDPDNDNVKIEFFSGVFSVPQNPATFEPNPAAFQSSVPRAMASINWSITCEHVRDQPYTVIIKITDNPPDGPKLIRFKTWNIKVMAPPPDWGENELNIVQRKIKLEWQPYTCSNATKMRILRRIGKDTYTPQTCDTGIPRNAGFTTLAEVNLKDSNGNPVLEFTDDNNGAGLSPGAQYCYRLVAIFPDGLGPSKVSIDTCFAPILAEAPVITHVSVKKTDPVNGEVIISWRSPYDLNKANYPLPYEYKILRARGYTGETGITSIQSGTLQDTTFTDQINTRDSVFNYRIVLYATTSVNSPRQAIDTSATASIVHASTASLRNKIEVNWSASVPWTNQSPDNPWHLIYRGPENATDNMFELIDSVNVLERDFLYADEGQYNNTPLLEYQAYCYKIVTRGTYGNPSIKSPQENYSQMICTTPLDTTPPCQPVLEIETTDCEKFLQETPCNQSTFSNTMSWNTDVDLSCQADSYKYLIYAAASRGEVFVKIDSTQELNFTEENLLQLARCYKIVAVDRSGNRSESSEIQCNSNCPVFTLPNVFSPNGDDKNEKFQAFDSNILCPRFVNRISLKIFDRWGKQVYSQVASQTDDLSWSGKDSDNHELATGVYYYAATIYVSINESKESTQELKGWVHLIR